MVVNEKDLQLSSQTRSWERTSFSFPVASAENAGAATADLLATGASAGRISTDDDDGSFMLIVLESLLSKNRVGVSI